MRIPPTFLLAIAALSLHLAGCGDDTGGGTGGGGAVDAACETDDDCQEGLECDDHDGEATCQEPHDD